MGVGGYLFVIMQHAIVHSSYSWGCCVALYAYLIRCIYACQYHNAMGLGGGKIDQLLSLQGNVNNTIWVGNKWDTQLEDIYEILLLNNMNETQLHWQSRR